MTFVEMLRSRAWEHRQHRELREQAARRIEELETVVRAYVAACDNEECEYCIAAKAALFK